jgi:Lipocalin-like domain
VSEDLRDQLIGAWKLVSYEERPVDGSPAFHPLGENPRGIIM